MFPTLHPEKKKSIKMMTTCVMKYDMNKAILRLRTAKGALAEKKGQCARNKCCGDVIKSIYSRKSREDSSHGIDPQQKKPEIGQHISKARTFLKKKNPSNPFRKSCFFYNIGKGKMIERTLKTQTRILRKKHFQHTCILLANQYNSEGTKCFTVLRQYKSFG